MSVLIVHIIGGGQNLSTKGT